MKKPLVVFMAGLFLGVVLVALAQDPPSLPVENRAAILAIQLRMEKTQNQYNQLYTAFMEQASIKQLQDSYNKDMAALQAAQLEGCKAAKADCDKDWTLNLATLKFDPKGKPEAKAPTKPSK